MAKSSDELRGLALEFLRLGEVAQAERAAARLIAVQPEDVDANLVLGAVEAARGQWEACVRRLLPMREDPRAARWLARAYWALGKGEEALLTAQPAIESDALDAEALSELGHMALTAEAANLAVAGFRRATSKAPESPSRRDPCRAPARWAPSLRCTSATRTGTSSRFRITTHKRVPNPAPDTPGAPPLRESPRVC